MRLDINSQLLRCSTARGSSMRFSLVGPTIVQAYKSFMFTLKLSSIENKEHLFDSVITFDFKALLLLNIIPC